MSTTYRVDGMSCGGCARSVTNAITQAAPGTTVAVDLATGTVTVDGSIAAAMVQDAVEKAGFDYRGPAQA